MAIKNLFAVSLAALGLSAISHADVGGSLTITSDYLSRGVTQTNNQPAVQGSIDLVGHDGLYAGAWISNIDKGSEIDLYAGLIGMLDQVSYDVGAIGYIYPNADENQNYAELSATLGFHAFSAGVKYTVASEVNDTNQGNEKFIEGDWYYFVSADLPLHDDWGIAGTLGYYNFADDGVANVDTTYKHMEVSLSKAMEDLGILTLAISKASKESGNNNAQLSVAWSQFF